MLKYSHSGEVLPTFPVLEVHKILPESPPCAGKNQTAGQKFCFLPLHFGGGVVIFYSPKEKEAPVAEFNRIWLDDAKRLFLFPYPVRSIGYYPGDFSPRDPWRPKWRNIRFPPEKFELTLRLTSPSERLNQTVNSVRYSSSFPHAILKCPGHLFSFESPYATMNSLCLTYSRKIFQPLYEQHFKSGPLVWNVTLTPTVTELVRRILESLAVSNHFSMTDKLDLFAFELVEELLLQRLQHARADSGRHQLVEEIAGYLQLNCYRPVNLRVLVESRGMALSTFFRQWNRHFRETPVKYLNRLRMEEAGRLLRETGHSVQETAKLLCFSSTSYFCAAFRKHYGCPPDVYRRGDAPPEKKPRP